MGCMTIVHTRTGAADGILHEVLIDLDSPIAEVNAEQRPLVQRVVDGQAHPTARKVSPLPFQAGQDTMEPLVKWAGTDGHDGPRATAARFF